MKKTLILFCAMIILVSCDNIPVRPAQAFVDEVRKEVCPDRRVSIFDVDYEQKGKVITLKGETNKKAGADSLRVRLEREGYTVADKIRILPDPQELGDKTYAVVNRSIANIRVEPSERSEMATQALLGTSMYVYKKQRGQYYVQTPDGYLGWVEGDAITRMNYEEFRKWMHSARVIYLLPHGYVYNEPSSNSKIISDITMGSFLSGIKPAKNNFVEVAFPDGRIGYIERSKCEHDEYWAERAEGNVKDIIELAKSFMGVSYLWGGTSALMMDCSGLTRLAYMMNGIYLPRDASQQALVGKTVAEGKEELDRVKPGDLLFFGRKLEDGSERITHVAIYLGDGKFIHQTGTVRIESLNPEDDDYSEYRHNQFIRAKDVVNYIDRLNVLHVMSTRLIFLPFI
jgi:hypothetical protein